jgi:hypothetical protein
LRARRGGRIAGTGATAQGTVAVPLRKTSACRGTQDYATHHRTSKSGLSPSGNTEAEMDKSFLLLFFKKKAFLLLAFHQGRPAR